MAEERHTAAFVFGALLGGLAAAGYALWHAPQSGARTRARLAEYAESALFRITDAVGATAGGGAPSPRPAWSTTDTEPLPAPAVVPPAPPAPSVALLPDPLEPAPVTPSPNT